MRYLFKIQMLVKGNSTRGARWIRRTYEARTTFEAMQLFCQDAAVQDYSMEETDEILIKWTPIG